MSDTRIWDSKRGWVKPNRKFVINRTFIDNVATDDEWDLYEKASINEDSYNDHSNKNIDWKQGYRQDMSNPLYKAIRNARRKLHHRKITKILKLLTKFIPKVEVIE